MAETRKATLHQRHPGSARCLRCLIEGDPVEPHTDQTAQGEAGGVWECQTCKPDYDSTFTSLRYSEETADYCRQRGHDIRRVEGKA